MRKDKLMKNLLLTTALVAVSSVAFANEPTLYDIGQDAGNAALVIKDQEQDGRLTDLEEDVANATSIDNNGAVSYTHLTLPTIYSV